MVNKNLFYIKSTYKRAQIILLILIKIATANVLKYIQVKPVFTFKSMVYFFTSKIHF